MFVYNSLLLFNILKTDIAVGKNIYFIYLVHIVKYRLYDIDTIEDLDFKLKK